MYLMLKIVKATVDVIVRQVQRTTTVRTGACLQSICRTVRSHPFKDRRTRRLMGCAKSATEQWKTSGARTLWARARMIAQGASVSLRAQRPAALGCWRATDLCGGSYSCCFSGVGRVQTSWTANSS